MHLFGFIIRIAHHDARSSECQVLSSHNYLLCILVYCYDTHPQVSTCTGYWPAATHEWKYEESTWGWRTLHNEKSGNFAPLQTLIMWSKGGWDRRGKFQAKKKRVLGKSEGTKLLHKWGDNIKMDPRDIEWRGADLIHLAYNGYQLGRGGCC